MKGVLGRHAATYPGYPYSAPMRAAGEQGLVWTEENLSTFLKKPQAMVRGTWMAFPGLQKSQDILDIIAYLKQHAE